MAAIPFGHEIAVTPLQMLCSANAIANDGVMMKPSIVRGIVKRGTKYGVQGVSSPVPVIEFSPQKSRTPVSRRTARIMKAILTRAVENGTGQKAGVPGYMVAGKTGTAQKASSEGGYMPGKYVSSFTGFLSAENFVISMIVIVNEPQGNYLGSEVACPVFREIATQAAQYLTIGQRFYAEAARSAKFVSLKED